MNAFRRLNIGAAVLMMLAVRSALADVGSNNPTGVAGEFNGNVTTGCSYDSYTGNATRSVTDLAVAGGVGTYPLAFTRTSTSRYVAGLTTSFGAAGSWRHSYEWSIDPVTYTSGGPNYTPPLPSSYSVNYPDGRRVIFGAKTGDVDFRGPPGVRDRFEPIPPGPNYKTTYYNVYLRLPDGGKVWFQGIIDVDSAGPEGGETWFFTYNYTLKGIYDPYGQLTTVTYPSGTTLITEPAGRTLQLFYITRTVAPYDRVVSYVLASDGRRVNYNYSQYNTPNGTHYTSLTSVTYFPSTAETRTATYTYQNDNVGINGRPLLKTCDDPMYAGPMKKITYAFATGKNYDNTPVVYGQILSEKDSATSKEVSSLSVRSTLARRETRYDQEYRTFNYASNAILANMTDFNGVAAYQTADANGFIISVKDRNGKSTTIGRNALTGAITSITSPTATDVYPSSAAGTVTYTYGSPSCADTDNRDANNPYYVCTATDEGGHVTVFDRDSSKRVVKITYADGSYETFEYDNALFGLLKSHRLRTGGTETFTYGGRGLMSTYRNPSNATTGQPTARYLYDSYDRVSDITDPLGTSYGDPNHSTSFQYNLRGQVTVTTRATDPKDNNRHTITNAYNSDGTRQNVTDELGHVTSFTYDNYKRLRSVTTPARFTGDATHTTNFYYDASGTGDDYQYTDANVTYLVLPSGKKTKSVYDENRRKISVTAAYSTSDAATTTYTFDNNGNVTKIVAPNQQSGEIYDGKSTSIAYDERNRPKSVTNALGKITSFLYDTGGRKYKVTRPNGQIITYDSYDAGNRLLQQTVQQTATLNAVTKYAYYTPADGANAPVGLLKSMQDPRLVALNSSEAYLYFYDDMGRKTGVRYPLDSYGLYHWENWQYDTVGRLAMFTNRNAKNQTFTYDALHRMTGFSWDDGVTLGASFGYDVASRVISADNDNATIDFTYFNDNLLQSEEQHIINGDWWGGTVSYTYDADGNRASDYYPDGRDDRTYTYTGRNQLKTISEYGGWLVATYTYDKNGNIATRAPSGGTTSIYTHDELDRVTRIVHALNGTTRSFDYAYDDVGNRKWVERDDANIGDVFGYDLADQVTVAKLNVTNPAGTSPGSPTIVYDGNGNRTSFAPYGTTSTYQIGLLNEYTNRTTNGTMTSASYDMKGNLSGAFDGSGYTYDAQNRVTTASRGGTTVTFKYDALNRVITRSFSDGRRYNNIWDGWNLVLIYDSGNSWIVAPTHSPNGIEYEYNTTTHTTEMIYGDASGNTTHLANAGNGQLDEWYRYDLDGTPIVYDPAGNVRTGGSAFNTRHLFTGQQWYSELGLYDLRNRFYSPDIGRFLQPDPIDFEGDPTNLYRYCGNNPVTRSDPSGLWQLTFAGGDGIAGILTFGFNSGQFNFRVYGGVGEGLFFNYNPNDSGPREAGRLLGIGALGGISGEPAVPASLEFTSYGDRDSETEIEGRLGNLNGGVRIRGNGKGEPTGVGFSFGAALVAGIGGGYYSLPPSSSQAMVMSTSAAGPTGSTWSFQADDGTIVVGATPIAPAYPQIGGYSPWGQPIYIVQAVPTPMGSFGAPGLDPYSTSVSPANFDILPGGQLGVPTIFLPPEPGIGPAFRGGDLKLDVKAGR